VFILDKDPYSADVHLEHVLDNGIISLDLPRRRVKIMRFFKSWGNPVSCRYPPMSRPLTRTSLKTIFGFILLCLPSLFFAQDDTAHLNKDIRKAYQLLESNLDSAHLVINKCVAASRKNKFSFQLNRSLLALMQYYDYRGKPDSAMLFMDEALLEARSTKNTKRIVYTLLKGSVLHNQAGRFDKAVEFAVQAQKVAEPEKDTALKIKVLHDIGFLYSNNNLEKTGIGYYKEAYALSVASKDTFNMANLCARIGGSYDGIKQSDSSLHYNELSLNYFTLIHHKRGIGICYNNLANLYVSKKDYQKGIDFYKKAITLRSELGDTYALMMLWSNLGIALYDNGDYQQALNYFETSQKECLINKNYDLITTNYLYIALCHHHLGHEPLYYKYSQLYITLKDSIRDSQNLKAIAELQAKYESDKNLKQIKILQLERNQNKLLDAEKLKRNYYFLFFVCVVITLLGAFIYVLVRRYRFIQRQQRIISEQKTIVDIKNQEIIDSINYAKTIQEALIPTQEELTTCFTDSFILFRPKDIVSGDFYWMTKSGNAIYIAVADCTGHGVPGAFMSMMGITFLNELINEKEMDNTGDILDLLRIKVINTLNKNTAEQNKRDGMDIALCRIDMAKKQLSFSGANNGLYLLRSGALTEYKGNKQPVGLHSGPAGHFEEQCIELKKDDKIYLFTDGFPDQFGGPKGKKFKYKQLEDILISTSEKTLGEQSKVLAEKFDTWKGNLEQIDDVTLIGIRI
jgi:serine phosphatase RsbU (regulator of sigma subunit)